MAVLLLTIASSSCLPAKDWNQFRGPDGQGHFKSGDLPLKWNRKDSVDWKTELPGKAWSSPISVGKTLVLTNAIEKEGEGLELEALALDLENGESKWKVTLFSYDNTPRIHKKNSHASPTPFYDGELIFVHFGNLGTACLSTEGKVVWKKRYDYSPVHGIGCSRLFMATCCFLARMGQRTRPSMPWIRKRVKYDGRPIEKARPRGSFPSVPHWSYPIREKSRS